MGACRKGDGGVTSGVPFVAFDRVQVTSKANRSNPKPGDPCHTIHEGEAPAVAVGQAIREMIGPSVERLGGMAVGTMAVRRLTPREVERCFGMPDDWTLITVRGKPAADGPRYKACGNSWCIPPVRWIGERLDKAVRP
jgi:DNA (cytosine-5)-methyltransferase 1